MAWERQEAGPGNSGPGSLGKCTKSRAPQGDPKWAEMEAGSPAGSSTACRSHLLPLQEDSTWEPSAPVGLAQLFCVKHQSPEAGGLRGFLYTGPGFCRPPDGSGASGVRAATAMAAGGDRAAGRGGGTGH